MRFTMSSDDKQSTEVPSFVISPTETSSTPEKKSQKRTVIIAVTCVAVAILVLICVLVSVYMFTEAEKEITKLKLELKNNMTQDVTSNPNTNTVQFHVQQKDQEAWIINDYNSDLKVMKIQTSAGTNCFVTPLNESSPTDLPSMKSLDTQKADTIALVYSTNGSPIKDTSFLSKTARDACQGVSTYWLYPSCDGSNGSKPPNTTDLASRQKRGANYYTSCGGYYFVSNYNFYYTCSYYYCYAPYLTTCYTFSATWFYPYSRSYPYYAYMYKCLYYGFSGCISI